MEWRLVGDADDEGGFFVITGIQDAAQFVVALKERVRFINQQGRLNLFDDAEKGRRTDVGGDDRAIDQLAGDGQQGGLAAAFLWRLDADVGAHVPEVEGERVNDPEGQSFGGPPGKDHEAAEDCRQGVKE